MSKKPRVLVGISMHPQALEALQAQADVEVALDFRPRLRQRPEGYQGLIAYVADVDPALLAQMTQLEVVACHACPPDVLDAATAHDIQVTLAPSLRDTVADMTLALIFAAARNIAQADAAIRAGRWRHEDLKIPYSGLDVFGKTLGIVGMGRIGAILARRVSGMDMPVLYYDTERKPALEKELGVVYRPLDALLAVADIVSLLVRLDEDSRGMIGERELALMKPDAILINTARGALVDEAALCRALAEKRIAAAGLDVMSKEPLSPDNPLLKLDNVVLAPHLGGSTKGCDMVLVRDTLAVLAGRAPLHPAT